MAAHLDPWTPPRAGRRGPRPSLSRERLVRAAVAIADREGLGGVSMEAVARRLGITAMALYRYVPGKDGLVALMIDDGLGPPPRLSGAWRRRLLTWAEALAEVFRRHPWSLEATSGLRAMGPNELAWLDAGMASLAATPLRLAQGHSACLTLLSVVRTFALFGTPGSGGLSRRGWEESVRARIAERPDLSQVALLVGRPRARTELRDALGWVLDGIAAKVERSART